MRLKTYILGIAILGLVLACSSSKNQDSSTQGTTLIDTLTDFSIAINANNYKKAVSFLVDSEKRELTDPVGNVPTEVQRKLKALKLQVLIKNPRIKLEGSKLAGIVSALPSLEHRNPDISEEDFLKVETQLENVEEEPHEGEAPIMEEDSPEEGMGEYPEE